MNAAPRSECRTQAGNSWPTCVGASPRRLPGKELVDDQSQGVQLATIRELPAIRRPTTAARLHCSTPGKSDTIRGRG
jgi:hypothetical protein